MKVLNMIIQVGILASISLVGNWISSVVSVGLPGNIIGIFILLLLLERNVIALRTVELGANFLIAELLLFFIPSAIGIMQFQDILQSSWLPILGVIAASTLAVLFFVGVTAEGLLRLRTVKG